MAHLATSGLRRSERLALSAQPASIVTVLVGHGLRLLGIGAVIGLSTALTGTRYIEALNRPLVRRTSNST